VDNFQTRINITISFQYKPANARQAVYLIIFFDCLIRDLNYGLWPVTTAEQHHPVPHATFFCVAPPWIYNAERRHFHVREPPQYTDFCSELRSVILPRWRAKYVCIPIHLPPSDGKAHTHVPRSFEICV